MSTTPPQSSIFHRSLDRTYPVAVDGDGVFLITKDGRRILDGSSGAAVSSLGHNNQEIIESIVRQTQNLSFAHTSFFTSEPAEELATFLLEKSKGAFAKVCFLGSGSEAVETALKIARQFHVINGQPERVNFIARNHSYHGNTLGALSVGNNPSRREVFGPILSPAFHHVSRCFYAKDARADDDETTYEDRLILEFREKIDVLGAATVAAIVVEPVVGATLGSVPATSQYLPKLRQLCDKHGILLIFDEVMCGMGRVGTYHAWQGLGGASPHLQTIGKGLGGGYQPLSAVLIDSQVSSTFQEAAVSGGGVKFISGHTFQGHPVACAGALTAQRIIERDDLVQNVVEMGRLLYSRLTSEEMVPLLGKGATVRGLGLFRTFDFGKIGTDTGVPLAAEVLEEMKKNGAVAYPCSNLVDALLFAPPFIISRDEIELLADVFTTSVNTVLSRRGGSQ